MSKILYYGDGHIRLTVVIGLIHLGKLPWNRVPSIAGLFNVLNDREFPVLPKGAPTYLGNDGQNNQIYLINLGKSQTFGLQAIKHILSENKAMEEWQFFSALEGSDLLVKAGGIFIEFFHLIRIGNLFSAFGIRRRYNRLVNFVRRIKGVNLIGET